MRTVEQHTGVLAAVNRVLSAALTDGSDEEIGRACLSAAQELTGSPFGIICVVDSHGRPTTIAASDSGWDLARLQSDSFFGSIIDGGKAALTNTPASHRDDTDRTHGHAALLGAPLAQDGRFVGVVALARDQGSYSDADVQSLEALAPAIGQVLGRRHTARVLSDSERWYRTIVETAQEGILIGAPDGRILFANQRMADMLGCTREEIVGRTSTDFIPAEGADAVLRGRGTLHEGGLVRGEFELRRRDGTPLWTLASATPLTDDAGEHVANVAMHTDITERRRAEGALRGTLDQAAWLGRFPEENPSPVLRVSAQGLVLYRNEAARRTPGWGSEVGGPPPAPLSPLVRRALETALAVREDIALEGRYYSVTVAPVPADGYANVYVADVSEHRRTEEALRQARAALERNVAELHAVLDSLTEGLVIADLDGHLFHWNPAAVAMHGFATMEECRRRLPEFAKTFELSTPADGILPLERWPLARILGGETLHDWEVTVSRHDGDWRRVFRYGGTLARDKQGQPVLAVVSVTDVTERQKAEQSLRESREDLNRAQAVARTGSWRLDVRHDQLLWSDETHRMFGIPPGTPLTYETFLACLHPDDRNEVDRCWQAALGGAPYDCEHRIVVGDAVRWVRERAELELDRDGTLLGGFGTVQDITGRKLAEEALQRAHDTLEQKVLDRTEALLEVNQTLRMISACNGALVRATTEEELVQEVCRIIAAGGRYRAVWVAYAADDEAQTVHASLALPLIASGRTLGALTLHADEAAAFGPEQTALLSELADDLAFGILARRAALERDRAREVAEERARQLAVLATELGQVEQRERRRLAKVLHDHLQQLLVGAKYGLATVESEAPANAKQRALRDVMRILEEAIETTSSLTAELSPPALHERGLLGGIEWLSRQMRQKYGLRVDVRAEQQAEPASEEVRLLLFDAVRELLFNVVKHAKVDRARVDVERLGETELKITVADDGAGLRPDAIGNGERLSGGFGLFSVRERLACLGGSVGIESRPGHGCSFTLVAPALQTSSELTRAPSLPASAPAVGERRPSRPVASAAGKVRHKASARGRSQPGRAAAKADRAKGKGRARKSLRP